MVNVHAREIAVAKASANALMVTVAPSVVVNLIIERGRETSLSLFIDLSE
jgi:hypothetical protein